MLINDPALLDFNIKKKLKGSPKIEMRDFESAFLAGLIKKYKPKRILEVGVAAGDASALILSAIKDYGLDARLFSVDLNVKCAQNRSKETGYVAKENFPNAENWQMFTGASLPSITGRLPEMFDMAIINAVHPYPWDLLDYLVILKIIDKDGVIIFNNTHLYFHNPSFSNTWLNKVIYDASVGDKIFYIDATSPIQLPNIVALKLTPDTFKYIDNLYSLLSVKWNIIISENEFTIYYNFYKYYYGLEVANYFKFTYENNKKLFSLDDTKIKNDTINKRKDLLINLDAIFHKIGNYKLKPIFSSNYTYIQYPLSNDGQVHYEIMIVRNTLRLALHLEQNWSENEKVIKDIILKSNIEEKINYECQPSGHKIVGCHYEVNLNKPYVYMIDLFNYLISISLDILKENKMVSLARID